MGKERRIFRKNDSRFTSIPRTEDSRTYPNKHFTLG